MGADYRKLDGLKTQGEFLLQSAYSKGYKDGKNHALEECGNATKGVAQVEKATPQEQERIGLQFAGWCKACNKPLDSRWAVLANFCPWCGRVLDWDGWSKDENSEDTQKSGD